MWSLWRALVSGTSDAGGSLDPFPQCRSLSTAHMLPDHTVWLGQLGSAVGMSLVSPIGRRPMDSPRDEVGPYFLLMQRHKL